MPEAVKFSEWIDKLCGIMIKMHYFNHQKLEERKKKKPNLKKLHEIQKTVDTLNEQRYVVWNEIDKMLKRIVETGKYDVFEEKRTYEGQMPVDDKKIL